MKRFFDMILSAGGLLVASPLFAVLAFMVWKETGSPLFRQERVGRHKKPFVLVKFRTMRLETPQVATHLVAAAAVTPLGKLLRRTKLDELPQLWNVMRGEMSLVGPRPCLYSQTELIRAREEHGVFDALPGITGLAQLSGVDMSDPIRLSEIDAKMLERLTLSSYLRYILLTATGHGTGDQVRN